MGTLESKIAKFIFPFLLISLGTVAYAADTTLRVKSITKDIDVVQSILDDNMISVEGVVNEISHLEYQTLAARKIVRLIDDQGKASTAELDHLNAQLLLLAQEKKLAVERYQTLILEEYKNRDYKTKLYFLASSKNLTEFVNRLNHLNTLKEFSGLIYS